MSVDFECLLAGLRDSSKIFQRSEYSGSQADRRANCAGDNISNHDLSPPLVARAGQPASYFVANEKKNNDKSEKPRIQHFSERAARIPIHHFSYAAWSAWPCSSLLPSAAHDSMSRRCSSCAQPILRKLCAWPAIARRRRCFRLPFGMVESSKTAFPQFYHCLQSDDRIIDGSN